MQILASVTFEQVLERFHTDHSCEVAHDANTNVNAESQLVRADELFGRWQRVLVSPAEMRMIVLPWHISEGGGIALVPASGLTVEQAAAKIAPIAGRYAAESPRCWSKLARMTTIRPLAVYLSATAIDGPFYDGLEMRDRLTSLDGLHRLVSWQLNGLPADTTCVEAFVAGVPHTTPPTLTEPPAL